MVNVCSNMCCATSNVVQGMSCSDNGGTICNGAGQCVNGCLDAMQDGMETDVDCGGPVCARCAQGKKCLVNSDCVTGACDPMSHVCVTDQ
jgi:hypothetical protein